MHTFAISKQFPKHWGPTPPKFPLGSRFPSSKKGSSILETVSEPRKHNYISRLRFSPRCLLRRQHVLAQRLRHRFRFAHGEDSSFSKSDDQMKSGQVSPVTAQPEVLT